MKGILLVGHGNLPHAFEGAVKMMVGNISSIHSLGLTPEEGPDDLKNSVNQLLETLKQYEEIKVFGDLFGGSPLNTVFQILEQDSRFIFISGMNFPMILTAALSPETPLDELILIGKDGIKNVRKPEDVFTKNISIQSEIVENQSTEPHELIHTRVDSRGIHGQVATAWIPTLNVNRIIVIDDQAIHDTTHKMALKMARPSHTKLSVLSTDTAIQRLNNPTSYPGERILVIIQRVETLATLADKGFYFNQVNLGNIPNRANTKKYLRTIHLTPTEDAILSQIIQKGTHVTAQMVPNDPLLEFNELLTN